MAEQQAAPPSIEPNVGGMEHAPGVPVTKESLAGALLDAARINVVAAMSLLPAPAAIIQSEDEDPGLELQMCLEQAANWLDHARAMVRGPVTSVHVVGTFDHLTGPPR